MIRWRKQCPLVCWLHCAIGHDAAAVGNIGGGMSAIQFDADGTLTGAACWRADGAAMGMGGGLARQGVRFVLPS